MTVKIPVHLCEDKMRTCGEKLYNYGWTNEELGEQIRALKNVIAYFEGRKDCNLIVGKLRMELYSFESYKFARENH